MVKPENSGKDNLMISRIFFCCWVIITLFVATNTTFSQSHVIEENLDIIKIENTNEGERYHLPGIEDGCVEVEICGMTRGANYVFHSGLIYSKASFSPTLLSGGRLVSDSPAMKFQATDECMRLELCIERKQATSIPYLSYARTNASVQGSKEASHRSDNGIDWNGSFSIEELVKEVLIGGDCFDVHNINAIGSTSGWGYFSNGMESIGLDEGVVLSTGTLDSIIGPNSRSHQGSSLGTPGDPDLESLTGVRVLDATGIEFDFIPTSQTARFRYVFASEEYCEFVNQGFNDVFGFFVSGPGINGDFENNAVNIALIPGTNDYVSIDNVNKDVNSNFYFDNTPEGQVQLQNPAVCGSLLDQDGVAIELIEFDGFTAVFEAVVDVIPCETYNIKMIVGDAGDDAYDSAVFLEAGSFDAGASARLDAQVEGTDSNIIFDNCHRGEFVISRIGTDNSEPAVVNLMFSDQSTAQPGIDFVPLPDSLIIPANQDSIVVPIDILYDTYSGGTVSIIYELDFLCSCTNPFAEIIITENPGLPKIEAMADDFLSCANEEVLLFGEILTPDLITDFQWQDSDGNVLDDGTNDVISVTEAGEFLFIGSNIETNCIDTAIVLVEVDRESPEAQIREPEIITCENPRTTLDGSASSSGSEIVYHWYTENGLITDGENEAEATAGDAGLYILDVINTVNGCIGTDSIEVTVDEEIPVIRVDEIQTLTCERELITIDASGSTPSSGELSFSWEILEGNAVGDANNNSLDVNEPGVYVLEVILERNQCITYDTFEVAQDIELPGLSTLEDKPLPCDDPQVELEAVYFNAGANPILNWTSVDGDFLREPDSNLAVATAVGEYIFSVKNSETGCSSTDTVHVFRNEPTAINFELSQPICPGDPGVLSVISVENGFFPYEYHIAAYGGDTPNDHGLFSNLQPGEYELWAIDELGCRTKQTFEVDEPRVIEVELPEDVVAELGVPRQLEPELNFPETEIALVQWTPQSQLDCPDCLTTEVELLQSTRFHIYVEDIYGCPAEAETFVLLQINDDIFVPNAFSPNGDGINDNLEIFAHPAVKKIIDFNVYDRWGTKVFQNRDFPPNENGFGWDGNKDGEEAPPGVYLFSLKYELINGEQRVIQGEVSILR